jgi:hypothetical protein
LWTLFQRALEFFYSNSFRKKELEEKKKEETCAPTTGRGIVLQGNPALKTAPSMRQTRLRLKSLADVLFP